MVKLCALLSRIRKWWPLDGEDKASSQACVAVIRARFEQALRKEAELGWQHKCDSYYTDISTGHNIGSDELSAVVYAQEISLVPNAEEQTAPGLYLERLLGDLEEIKERYRKQEADPDGYGIGTLHNLTRKLRDSFEDCESGRHIVKAGIL